MKKIGFIDLFIDEWHANNYPAWIRQARRGSEFELFMAWEEYHKPEAKPLAAWCEKYDVRPARSIDEVVEACDAILVLAPSNPEVHEKLAELPLRSGKPVYIDKPFAPDKAAAERLFALAAAHGTPMFSSSALRFSDELLAHVRGEANKPVKSMITWGGGSNFPEYVIHQLEMIVSTMGTGVGRLMYSGNSTAETAVLEYSDDRRASLTLSSRLGFGAMLCCPQSSLAVPSVHHMFENLLEAILEFFATGVAPVPQNETIEIAALLDAAIRASAQPGVWLEVK